MVSSPYRIVDAIKLHDGNVYLVVRARAYKPAGKDTVYIGALDSAYKPVKSATAILDFPVWFADWKDEHNCMPGAYETGRIIEVALPQSNLGELALTIVAVRIGDNWMYPQSPNK